MTIRELTKYSFDIRKQIVDLIIAGNVGHIVGDISVLAILFTLYHLEMHISPAN